MSGLGILQPLWNDFRSIDITFGALKVTWGHVTASSCELQACKKWNVLYTPVINFLQPLLGDFRSNDVTSGSLPVTWGHVTSVSVTWLPPPASYSLLGSEMYSTRKFSAFYSHFQVTSGVMTSLPGHFRSPEVTLRHFLSSDCLLLQTTALLEVKCTVFASFRPSTAASRALPLKRRHFWFTSGHLWSRYVIFCHGTASSCDLRPCRKWNVHYTLVFGIL